jgi:hypothetical protein
MVSWSRVLAGDFKDPLVGRDLLVGSAVAACVAGISGLIAIGYELGLLNPLPPNNLYDWNSTRGMLQSIGQIALAPVASAGTAFGMYMTTLFFLLLTRNKTASAILFGCVLLLLSLSEMSDPLSSIEPAVWASMVVLCIRYLGIFGFFSVLLMGRLIAVQPITVDPQNILFPQSVLTLIVVLLAVGWAARTALGGKAVSGER